MSSSSARGLCVLLRDLQRLLRGRGQRRGRRARARRRGLEAEAAGQPESAGCQERTEEGEVCPAGQAEELRQGPDQQGAQQDQQDRLQQRAQEAAVQTKPQPQDGRSQQELEAMLNGYQRRTELKKRVCIRPIIAFFSIKSTIPF